VDYNYG